MKLLASLALAGLLALLSWRLASNLTVNLPVAIRLPALMILSASGFIVALLTSLAILRRRWALYQDLVPFSIATCALGGAIIGAVWLLTLTVTYMLSYGSIPTDPLQVLLTVLWYPLSALLGGCVGALLGGFVGLVAGSLFRLTAARGG